MRYVKNSGVSKRRSSRSRARKRAAVTASVLAALALVAAYFTRPHAPNPAPSAPTLHPAAAVVQHPKPVRTSSPAWSAADASDLRRAVQNALDPALTGARDYSLLVLAHDGRALYESAPDRAVVPASVQKLVAADAALSQLGPGYRYTTLLAASKAPQGGVLDGDLWVITSGDPSLRSRDMSDGVHALRSSGLSHVNGAVAVDGSALAGNEINSLWNADDANEDFMAATSGASIDEDTVEFDVTGARDGDAAQVHTDPAQAPVRTQGGVLTGSADDVTIAAADEPNRFRLSGSIPAGAREKFWVPIHGIPNYLGAVVNGMLAAEGIATGGPPQTGTAPVESIVLWRHRSRALTELVKHMLVFSDNHYAEQIMRTLGAAAGDPGNDADGIAEERAALRSQAIPDAGLHLVDGSGLAHANRVSARTLAGILLHFDLEGDGKMLYALLPRGGKDGTLKRYGFDAAAGRVRAKSGHLSDAASLAGYVDTQHHGRLMFAFLINGSPGDPDTAIVRAVDAIAQR